MVNALLELTQSTRRLLEECDASLTELAAADQLQQLSLGAAGEQDGEETLREAAETVRRQLENSYRSSRRELSNVLQYKVEYLSACLL